MYLTSFVHREELFDITGRWLCNRFEPTDGLRLTQILICDGFVLGETLDAITRLLLSKIHANAYSTSRISFKGELREFICKHASILTPRVGELLRQYRANPEFFYVEAPINGSTCIDGEGRLLGVYRIKRPRRIAEKANRYIANWIFRMVQDKAQRMDEERAERLGIPLHYLLTPEEEMEHEFVLAEETIAHGFKDGRVELDRAALTIPDVGGIKLIAEDEALSSLETSLQNDPFIRLVEQEKHEGDYRARNLIIDVPWDRESICRRYKESRAWQRYLDRGIAEDELRKGLEPFLDNTDSRISIELILSTFPDFVESELGTSIHEERIVAQRNHKVYKGYIPSNIEFLIEYLFGVGLSPQTNIERLPVKLWGRYLPDSISYYIRQLYGQPEHDALY